VPEWSARMPILTGSDLASALSSTRSAKPTRIVSRQTRASWLYMAATRSGVYPGSCSARWSRSEICSRGRDGDTMHGRDVHG